MGDEREQVVLSGTGKNGDPAELIAPRGTLISVMACGECQVPLKYGGCPQCEDERSAW